MATTRARGSYAVGIARREFILETASAEFATNGYRGASLAQISEKVGLTQAGVLHYFPSKPALLIGVLEHRDAVDAEMLGLLDVDSPEGRGLAALDRLARLIEINSERRGIVQLFTVIIGEAVTDDHPAHAWATQRYTTIKNSLAMALEHGIEDGTVQPETDVAAVTGDVFAMMDGLQIQWLLDPSVDMVGAFQRYLAELTSRIGT